ncbi:protein LYK5-like [Phoenix dactylifera]|uniref:Protein LYK5-like n=1 Tax=Phoenix dactylifera TaxID=42345 RepID=A0A8B9AJG4_PHODC|nr:protein LYK5-like [Phoenix dactylifera]XP_038984156.1 protein LYK5-like [Phoenix dactylifera]XP_038984163.1 protein LYK5-like [Phoenix dactylifera]XP_038984171.1 protein LYK5-like [Phoenix dactylifera]XP_038984174.1 protein LYK5-like [Phoenix dactylifera]
MGKLKPSCSTALLLFSVLFCFPSSQAQQEYLNNAQLACYATNGSSTLGYSCNGQRNSCSTFLTFRSQTSYQSPVQIGQLLNVNASNVSTINGVADGSRVPVSDLVFVPAACSCSGKYYQHNASYTIKSTDTYFIVANYTYQGLSTCQALMAQNPYNSRNLPVGEKLVVPLRCACPTSNQTASGFKYLLSYLVATGDNVDAIAQRFNTDSQSILDANDLSSSSVINFVTTLLVPLKTEPTKEELVNPPPPPSPPPPTSPGATSDKGSSNKKWIGIGIGIGVGVLAICGVLVWFLCWRRRRERQPIPQGPKIAESPSDALVSSEIRSVIGSLTLYKFQELESATGSFGEDHRIKGSVYRAVINGDNAAVKRLKGDVSNEIDILKHVNHSNVVRLSGFCLHGGNTYLVYEFAERGSLSDWLHRKRDWSGSSHLGWRQRVQIAHDVADGLNYLHNYVSPPYVHKNLKSSNILLGREFRAKLSNFGLARPVEDSGGPLLTRHVVGTQGYLAPEYLEHGLITPKIDVFAFGVVMLELLSGKEATFAKEGDEKKEVLLWSLIGEVLSGEDVRSKLRSFVDPYLQNDYPFDLAFAMAELAMRCVTRDPASRPSMTEVFLSLAAVYNSTLDWDPSNLKIL